MLISSNFTLPKPDINTISKYNIKCNINTILNIKWIFVQHLLKMGYLDKYWVLCVFSWSLLSLFVLNVCVTSLMEKKLSVACNQDFLNKVEI